MSAKNKIFMINLQITCFLGLSWYWILYFPISGGFVLFENTSFLLSLPTALKLEELHSYESLLPLFVVGFYPLIVAFMSLFIW